MLVEFRVANYRSIREPQVLSLVASKDTSLIHSNCFKSGINAAPTLLRSAVLYGPNAGGKSNLIAALAFMRSMIETSAVAIREGQMLNVAPFRFDSESTQQPSAFEVTFVDGGVRYQYGFALTAARVTKEWLLAYAGRKAQRWFEREYDAKTGQYNWYLGTHLQGGQQRRLWKESTRANALFLSTAVNLNSEQLRNVFNWFVNKLVVLVGNMPLAPLFTIERLKDDREKAKIIQFLQAADLGVTDVRVEMQKRHTFQLQFEAGKLPVQAVQETEIPIVTLLHKSKNEKVVAFNLAAEEPQGTQRLFAYAGPFLKVLQQGCVLAIDELDNSLHPKMIHFLVKNMHNPEINSHNAQLIFSTHDISLLDADLFRRDQIWFIEKDQELASKLYPLIDFSPRKDEALEKGYLMGRYGALPVFNSPGDTT